MKGSELKIRLINGINLMVDEYFGSNTITDKFINATLKIIIKQNEYKLDSILKLFTDEHGDVNVELMVEEYAKALGQDGIIIDIRDFIESDAVKRMLPNKSLMVKRGDIERMLL